MNKVIEVKNVSKKYDIHPEERTYKILQQDLLKKLRNPLNLFSQNNKQKEFWALKNVSFSVNKGEILGIIGQNGSGKSTLLRILGHITSPTKGEVIIRGKVNSLLEAGPGFHLELTGRENVFLNGIILGISRERIAKHFGDIVKFSGIEKFIDTPVKYYSAGMYVRLAFSIALYLETDILLVDEVLSVGDAEFQKRSYKAMEEVTRRENRTIILVSHDLKNVGNLCDRVLLLQNGKIKEFGGSVPVIDKYIAQKNIEFEYKTYPQRGPIHVIYTDTNKLKAIYKINVFKNSEAQRIDKARLEHLESLRLELKRKKVLDVNSGIGNFVPFFIQKNCQVVCLDGRWENIDELRRRYPNLSTGSYVLDVERNTLTNLGFFEVVFCYSSIYHVEKPALVLEKLGRICTEILLLESCITDYSEPLNLWVSESREFNQALHGIGSRPTPSYLITSLHKAGFSYVYFPKKRPKHEDFIFKYQNNMSFSKDGHVIRQIFVASKNEIINNNLQLVSFQKQQTQDPNLENINSKELQKMAKLYYCPQPLLPIPSWMMGILEQKQDFKRQPLKDIWEFISKTKHKHIKTIEIDWYKGIKLNLYPKSQISRSIYIEGCYEPNELYFFSRLLKPGMYFIDIGANFGVYSLFSASILKSDGGVLAIEPSDREYKRLLQQIKLNNFKNIIVLKMALSNQKSIGKLNVASVGYEGHNTLGAFAYPGVTLDKREQVKLDTLDNVVRKSGFKKVDVIKIDVEGAELKVLQGGKKVIKKYQPVILIEISEKTLEQQKASSKEIIHFFNSLSYLIFEFDKKIGLPKISKNKDYNQGENVIALPKSKEKLLTNI